MIMQFKRYLLQCVWLAVVVTLVAGLDWVSANSLYSVIVNIQKSYDAIKDFKAQFVQESVVKSWNAKQVQKAEGNVYFKKEGKMFWDYQKPTPQQIISDGKMLWFFEPEDEQVTVTEVSDGLQSQISADLLNGKAQLTRDFKVREITSEADVQAGNIVLELIPNASQPNLSKIIMRLNNENFQIYQTEVYDLFENLTRITFSQIQIDTNLNDSLFTFTPPPGVEILSPPTVPLPQR
jgi:outer membrane lipoprotein carrier protein